jgi:CheY-like chemotaxis protein
MDTQPAILYVEDDPHSRRVMQLLLNSQLRLSQIALFTDSADFLTRLQDLEPAPDLIFLDIHVRPHNGFEMLEMLRAQPRFKQTPVVALTASVMNEEVAMLRSAGFDGCISKPISLQLFPEQLQAIIRGEQVWSISG